VLILVIDDDASSLNALRELLELDGHQVVCAENGRDALRRLREEDDVGLILLDLMMPVMNGWEFRRKQLEDSSVASIPVVAVTAGEDATGKAKRIGVEHCLQKPLSPEEVLDVVRSYDPPISEGSGADAPA
jgi:CheY-like chemotaxis protein